MRHLVGKQVYVGKERLPWRDRRQAYSFDGVSWRDAQVPIDALRIDLGLAGKAKVRSRGLCHKVKRVGPSIMAKSLDNRFGVATVIELFKGAPSNIDLCAAFTVQEERSVCAARKWRRNISTLTLRSRLTRRRERPA